MAVSHGSSVAAASLPRIALATLVRAFEGAVGSPMGGTAPLGEPPGHSGSAEAQLGRVGEAPARKRHRSAASAPPDVRARRARPTCARHAPGRCSGVAPATPMLPWPKRATLARRPRSAPATSQRGAGGICPMCAPEGPRAPLGRRSMALVWVPATLGNPKLEDSDLAALPLQHTVAARQSGSGPARARSEPEPQPWRCAQRQGRNGRRCDTRVWAFGSRRLAPPCQSALGTAAMRPRTVEPHASG